MIEDFENINEWHHNVTIYPVNGEPYQSEVGEIFVPNGWNLSFWHGLPVTHDPQNDVGWSQPEARFVHKADFPYRVYSNDHAYMWFTFYRIHHVVLHKSLQVIPGQTLKASVYMHSWSSNNDDPHNSTDAQKLDNVRLKIGIDPTGNTRINAGTIIWSEPYRMYDTYQKLEIDSVIAQSEWATLFIRSVVLYPLKHNDVYLDLVEFETSNTQTWYPPREQYNKEYWLMPNDATQEQHKLIAERAYNSRTTVGYSADDAGSGPQSRKIVAHWCSENSWRSKPDVQLFFDTYYPNAQLKQIDIYDTGTPPITGNPIGLHVIQPAANWEDYVRDTRPKIVKVFQPDQALRVKELSPTTQTIWRFFVDNDGYYACNDPVSAPQRADELFNWYWQAGLHNPEIAKHIDFIESVNEVIGTFSGCTPQAVAFDAAFVERVHQSFPDNSVKSAILTIPVGNPHETEFELLIPAVEKVCQYKGIITYHSYWTANKTQNWLSDKWPYHAGRWTIMDEIFSAYDLYPLYAPSEGGIVYSENGDDMHSGKGWKSCGDIYNYIQQLKEYKNIIDNWNAQHSNRFIGVTLFTTGGWEWDDFKLEGSNLLAMRDALV